MVKAVLFFAVLISGVSTCISLFVEDHADQVGGQAGREGGRLEQHRVVMLFPTGRFRLPQ
jgi:hypothetical protein